MHGRLDAMKRQSGRKGAHGAPRPAPRNWVRPAVWGSTALLVAGVVAALAQSSSADSELRTASGPSALPTASTSVTSSPSPTAAAVTPTTGAVEPPAAAASTPTRTHKAAPPAGVAAAAVPGFRLVFSENFNAPAAAGQFLNVYGAKWDAYNGFKDTDRIGNYNQNILTVNNGILDMYLHSENGVPQVAAPVPLITGNWGGERYGRFSVRFRADALPNYKTAWLLWPDSNNWNSGEIDFPEGELNGTIYAFNHQIGNPSNNAFTVNTGRTYTGWHTATTEWTPSGVRYYLDGALVGSSPVSPSVPMHMILQTETSGQPSASTAGHVQIDSVDVWSYTG